jgi:hypothetical protein
VIFSVAYLLARRLLGCLMVLARREVSKDAELLMLRPENAVLRRQIVRVRYVAMSTQTGPAGTAELAPPELERGAVGWRAAWG